MNTLTREQILQLFADRATEGLDTATARELSRLVDLNNDRDARAFERAAAAVDLALAPPADEPMPAALRDRVLMDAGRVFSDEPVPGLLRESAVLSIDKNDQWARDLSLRCGWFLAAASLILAVLAWWPASDRGTKNAPSPTLAYQNFVNRAPDVVRVPLQAAEPDFEGISGTVVWSDSAQSGFMRFVGMPINDPSTYQYQLWIVDPDRDKHPIDGGVFDVRTTGEVVIAFDATVPVQAPPKFAITCEKPGGVVVSSGPILVVGSVGS